MCRQIHIRISWNKNMKFWKHALLSICWKLLISKCGQERLAHAGTYFDPVACNSGARTTQWSCSFASACRGGGGAAAAPTFSMTQSVHQTLVNTFTSKRNQSLYHLLIKDSELFTHKYSIECNNYNYYPIICAFHINLKKTQTTRQ